MTIEEENKHSGKTTQDEIERIEEKTLELMKEIAQIKETITALQKSSKNLGKKDEKEGAINIVSLADYIDELIRNATTEIINEIRGEFYRLFNSLSSIGVPQHLITKEDEEALKQAVGEKIEKKSHEDKPEKIEEEEAKVELYRYLLNERETLIYELTDRIVAVETENIKLKDKLSKLEVEKEKWEKQKEFLAELIKTDPRFKIITLLKQTRVIPPVQLSFVLGVSLGQVRHYLKQLESLQIIVFNEDGSVQLNSEFDADVLPL